VSYRRHDNLLQDVGGSIISVHKDAYTIGPALVAQVDLGDAIYAKLAARQLAKAADYALESQRQEAIVAAAQGYFDLAKGQSAVAVAAEAVRISTNYAGQVAHALDAGIAFKGDLLRVQVQTERDRLTLRQAQEQKRVAGARLAQTLHLDSAVELLPDSALLPIELVSTNASIDSLVSRALSARPEIKQNHALVEAARQEKKGAVYGPIVPSVGALVFAGGLGGGKDGAPGTFGESEDYAFAVGWRIGPGGFFDRGRIHATESRLKIAQLTGDKLSDEITRQVIESQTRLQSQADQVDTARRAIQASEETLRLTEGRKQFAIGAVLETIQAEQELTRARLDYLNALAEYDKAQYALHKAIGGFSSVAAAKRN
jgi:outer membrane protein TolC